MDRRKRVCRKKEVFETEYETVDRIFKAWVHNRMYLRPYNCDVCGKFHLTKKGAKYEIGAVVAAALIYCKIKSAERKKQNDQ